MTFVSCYQMIFNLFKLEQIYNLILFNTMVVSSTITIVSKIIEYDQWMPQSRTADQPGIGTVRKGHKDGIVQALTVQYKNISSSFSFQCEYIKLR